MQSIRKPHQRQYRFSAMEQKRCQNIRRNKTAHPPEKLGQIMKGVGHIPLQAETEESPATVSMEILNRDSAQPLLLNIPEVATSLGLCRSKVYELIAKDGLPVIRFGRSVRVSITSLQKWVEEREYQHRPERDI
jgi:excisionase family DNA binding protein